ncbi:MAG: chorismate-binding protein [Bacteroidota bacterium]
MQIQTISKALLADTITPVSLYLRLRDLYPGALLLESSDYHGTENAMTFICLEPLATLELNGEILTERLPGRTPKTKTIPPGELIFNELDAFFKKFEPVGSNGVEKKLNGIFGYLTFDAVPFFETIRFASPENPDRNIPVLRFSLFRFVLAINHFFNTMNLIENIPPGEQSKMAALETQIASPVFASFPFHLSGGEKSPLSDEDFMKMVTRSKAHCQRGDVFQMVVSKAFSQQFQGDEFNVYRALRSVNPSPYLFFFDYGDFKIFGSSPEAQLRVKGNKAYIHPIAGTYRRTGDDAADQAAAVRLAADPKENAEHVMLVDLARNDLSRVAKNVKVDVFRETQFFSHVIHLVSTVSGELPKGASLARLLGETFPAGTLSGAPKFRAMQLIDEMEPHRRSFYGGCVGFLTFAGDLNFAIVIRSFLSKNNTLHYQAGAGVVKYSREEDELKEVFNKVGALRKALSEAEKLG